MFNTKSNEKSLLIILFFLFVAFLSLHKLDYPYFFTDEILYTDAGNEYFQSEFSKNLQHPLLAKYVVGFVTLFGPQDVYQNSVFLLRLPFALLLLGCIYLIYKILEEQFKNKYVGLLGAAWYFYLPFTFFANRMVMLEAPMHFFSLLFHLIFLRNLKKDSTENYAFAGVFMGLAIASKVPALILPIFALIIFILYTDRKPTNLVMLYLWAGISFMSTYLHYLFTLHLYGVKKLIEVFTDVILGRNVEGKPHIVNGKVYLISPWWYYYYYVFQKYTIAQTTFSFIGLVGSVIKRNKFFYYWLIFFALNLIFFQGIPLKAERYISTLEIPLTILFVSGFYYLIKRYNNKIFLFSAIALQIGFVFIPITIQRLNQQPNSYHALRIYIEDKTNNFTTGEKTYVSGSTRSMRWYKQNSAPEAFTFDNNFTSICANFEQYTYVAFDIDDLYREVETNDFYKVIQNNIDKYDKQIYEGFELYTKKPNVVIENTCLQNGN